MIEIFIKTPEQKILSLFAMTPDRGYYGREISRKLKISLGASHGALMSLEQKGILNSQNIGRTRLYRLDGSIPAVKIFKILNALLILEPLVRAIKGISRCIILFGSYSTGTFMSESDLDLFVVSEEKEKVMIKIENFERKISIDIRPIIKSQVEWMELEKSDPEFFSEVSQGVILWKKPIDESGF